MLTLADNEIHRGKSAIIGRSTFVPRRPMYSTSLPSLLKTSETLRVVAPYPHRSRPAVARTRVSCPWIPFSARRFQISLMNRLLQGWKPAVHQALQQLCTRDPVSRGSLVLLGASCAVVEEPGPLPPLESQQT